MKQDIQGRPEIEVLVDAFYDRVREDETIGFIFQRIIGADWSQHLPVMYRFWTSVLLGTEGYRGNTIAAHIAIDKEIPLQEAHFARWISLWRETVDDLYEGPIAEAAKQKGATMLQLIQFKVHNHRSGKSLI